MSFELLTEIDSLLRDASESLFKVSELSASDQKSIGFGIFSGIGWLGVVFPSMFRLNRPLSLSSFWN